MSINLNRYTEKAQEAIARAQELAQEKAVPRALGDVGVPAHGGQRDKLDLRGVQCEGYRDGVVDAGVSVEYDLHSGRPRNWRHVNRASNPSRCPALTDEIRPPNSEMPGLRGTHG